MYKNAHIWLHARVLKRVTMYIPTYVLLTLQECVSAAFQKADEYRQKFEPYRDFYRENEALDVEKFKEEDHG